MEQTLATTTKSVTHEEVKHESTLYAEPVFHIGTFAVTNALITSWVAVFVIVVLSTVLRLRMKKIPSKIQHFFEYIVEGGLSLADQITGNRRVSERVFPVTISIFFFILINNWLGILPLGGFGVIERGADGASFIPFIRSGTADINTTLMLALVSVIASNIFGVIVIGLWKAINKYINLKALSEIVTKVRKEPTVVIMAPVMFFVGLIEIVGEKLHRFRSVSSETFLREKCSSHRWAHCSRTDFRFHSFSSKSLSDSFRLSSSVCSRSSTSPSRQKITTRMMREGMSMPRSKLTLKVPA